MGNSISSFETSFDREKLTFLLIVDSNSMNLASKKKEADKLGLPQKKEFHITIIGSKTIKNKLPLLESSLPNARNKLIDGIENICQTSNFAITLKDEYYYIEKDYSNPSLYNSELIIRDERQSIIQMAEIDGLGWFYERLNLFLNKELDIPPPHVTLYTNSTHKDKKQRGIGIYSDNEFRILKPKAI